MQFDRSTLASRRGFPAGRAARAALLRTVFELDVGGAEAPSDPDWMPFGLYRETGACVGCVEATVLTMMFDGDRGAATAIRRAAVDPDWRGQGLFRDLMTDVLTWCDRAPGPTLLYTEDPALYERFGFKSVVQHRFSGSTPARLARPEARRVEGRGSRVAAMLRDRLTKRVPVSRQCAVVGADQLALDALLAGEDIHLADATDIDALVAYEIEDDTIVLVDIVAPAIPSMAEIAARLPARSRIATLFPPDALDWPGEPILDETGLMARGDLPPAMRRPFMLPPTADF